MNLSHYNDYLPPEIETYADKMERLHPEEKRRIYGITLQITEDCCMACTYCYQHNKTKTVMSFNTAKNIIDKLLNNEFEFANIKNTFGLIVDFIGGEPFMEIDLIEQIVEYTINKMIELEHPWLQFLCFSICSNGILYNTPKVQKFFKKYHRFVDLTISIDGNKELHDKCRVDLQGKGTYDRAIAAVRLHNKLYGIIPATKMTLSPENVSYVYDALVNLINEGYEYVPFNCVFENVWNYSHAKILYNELKKISDYLIDNELYNKVNMMFMLKESFYHPVAEDDNENWCGGVNMQSVAFDAEGNICPCIRYMKSSLNGRQKPLILGNANTGFLNTEEQIDNYMMISNITRRSQSTDKCFYCPIAQGCDWCNGFNYEEFGTPNKRATYVCVMHQAKSLANVYYWNKVYQHVGIDKKFKMHIPKEWALNIIDEKEYNYLLELSE